MKDFTLRTDTWPEMIDALKAEGFLVDSAYRRRPDEFVILLKDGKQYKAEVTKYFKGDYEIQSYNIHLDDEVEGCNNMNKRPVKSAKLPDGTEYNPEDYAGGYTEWEEIDSKMVRDSDGFWTDYTLWHNPFTDEYVCTFGDKDIYYPENAEYDAGPFETLDEAHEWFDDYDEEELFSDEDFGDPVDSSTKVECAVFGKKTLEELGKDIQALCEEIYELQDAYFGSETMKDLIYVGDAMIEVWSRYTKRFGE